MAARPSSSGWNPGSRRRARARNNASDSWASRPPSLTRRSPGDPSRVCEVTSALKPGVKASSSPSAAPSPGMCSALSSTSSRRPSSCGARTLGTVVGAAPAARATTLMTSRASTTSSSDTNVVPCGKASDSSRAWRVSSSVTRRVLPMPLGPVIVTALSPPASAARSAWSCRSRPTNSPTGEGAAPVTDPGGFVGLTVVGAGCASCSPAASSRARADGRMPSSRHSSSRSNVSQSANGPDS